MSKQRNRWLVIAVLSIATLAFVGASVIVPFTKAFQTQSTATPSPTLSPRSSPQADLEAQAKGYELVLQREPDNQTALRGLVDTRISQGKINEIVEPVERLAKLNPDQPTYLVLLAQIKQQNNDREGAAQAYRTVLDKFPGDLKALEGLTGLLLQQQRPEAAIDLLQSTLKSADEANKAQPGSVDTVAVQLLLGQVYSTQQRFDEAIALYDNAIQANKTDYRPILWKAIALQTQGKKEEAQPLFTSAAALAPAEFRDQINQLAAGVSPSPSSSPPEGSPSNSPESSAPSPDAAPAASPTPTAPASP